MTSMHRSHRLILASILTALLFLPVASMTAEDTNSFYTLNRQNGLSSNCVLQMLQLRDGRIVVVTDKAVDVYDGQRFLSAAIDTAQWVSLPAYNGATHLFVDDQDCLWMKQWRRLYCLNLRTMRLQTKKWQTDDFFIDSSGARWFLHGNKLVGPSNLTLKLPTEAGNLQDLESVEDKVYAFFATGQLAIYDKKDGKTLFRSAAYSSDSIPLYDKSSLVVCGFDSCFYQVRTNWHSSILLSFNLRSRKWKRLLTSPKLMHTLTATPTGRLYLTTPDGYLCINTISNEIHTFSKLHLPDGTTLSTGINTVWLDREGGIWLGTYNSGLLYTSPLSGLFDTCPLNIEVHPILTAIYLHGQPLQVGRNYDGNVLLTVTPPYADHLTFSHGQNSLAFQFSTMNYVRPRSTCYRYRFSDDSTIPSSGKFERAWHTISADSASQMVDEKGVFYLPLVSLPPGNYTLEVMATTNPNHWDETSLRRITFTIRPPWWQTTVAYIIYIVGIVSLVVAAFLLYRRRLQRKSREDLLLLRIQNLVTQVNQYEHNEAMVVLGPAKRQEEEGEGAKIDTTLEPSSQEKEFMARATQLVEQHVTDPSYNVERLAADLCMERTGLYKRLTTLMQQSPVAFIRSIRLQRAAAMLLKGDMTVTEIAEHTGFCSTSYFSKCFQKEFGCKPSEYTGK